MADQKRWFKVWTSIVANGRFAEMSLEDIGRWTLLGAATALDGDKGNLEIPGMGKELCRLLRVANLDDAKVVLKRILSVSFEEGKNRDGAHAVTWNNWLKYQEDSTAAERMKTLRAKRRGEEIRKDEKRGEHNSDTSFPAEAIEAAQLLSDKIFENFPQRTAPTEAQLMNWARDAEKINRIDQHSWPEISDLIKWSQEHSFWKANILSMSKFREQWNKLVAQRQRDSNNSKPNEPKGFAGIREWEKMQAKDKK